MIGPLDVSGPLLGREPLLLDSCQQPPLAILSPTSSLYMAKSAGRQDKVNPTF